VLYRLDAISSILSAARQSLVKQQVKPLAVVVTAGVQRERLKAGRADVEYPMGATSAAFQAAARKRVGENHAGILEHVAPVLEQQQLAALARGFEKQVAIIE
jgi:hypothetical protein